MFLMAFVVCMAFGGSPFFSAAFAVRLSVYPYVCACLTPAFSLADIFVTLRLFFGGRIMSIETLCFRAAYLRKSLKVGSLAAFSDGQVAIIVAGLFSGRLQKARFQHE